MFDSIRARFSRVAWGWICCVVWSLCLLLGENAVRADANQTVMATESLPLTTSYFADIYSESIGLMTAKTLATYSQLRGGWGLGKSWEAYCVARLGGDTRTVLDNTNNVYNDNYAFGGVGLDYLGLMSGVRLTAQFGFSKDLSSRINLGGMDGRVGAVSYHEIHYGDAPLYHEIYGEGFYFRRYSNILGSVQFRTFYEAFRAGKFDVAPGLTGVVAADSVGNDFNRFAEARAGLRIRYRGPVTVFLQPHWVAGARWARPTEYPTYSDARILLALFAAF